MESISAILESILRFPESKSLYWKKIIEKNHLSHT